MMYWRTFSAISLFLLMSGNGSAMSSSIIRTANSSSTRSVLNNAQLRAYQAIIDRKKKEVKSTTTAKKQLPIAEQNFPADYYDPTEYYDETSVIGRPQQQRPVRPLFDKDSISAMLSYIREIVGCGIGGWCGYECCSSITGPSRPWLPPAVQYTMTRENRKRANLLNLHHHHPGKSVRAATSSTRCPAICAPHCEYQCVLNAAAAESIAMARYPSREVGIPVCRPSCMPLCLDSCVGSGNDPPVTCRPACMPRCTPACVASPPLMVPCEPSFMGCFCPPGYVQCSENECCMRYRTMAVRYRNRLPGYLIRDAASGNVTIENKALKNETAVYMTTLRKMAGEILHELHKNGTVFFDPANRVVEIVYDDGEIVVSDENYLPDNSNLTVTDEITPE